mgnify:CR=1 FL=1
MNDDTGALRETFETEQTAAPVTPEPRLAGVPTPPEIPDYLQETYWWAYLHPKTMAFFEKEWVVNLILWGNMKRLTRTVTDDLEVPPGSRVLQVACVYGQFSKRLATHLDSRGARLDIVDVASIQIENARKKLSDCPNVDLHHQDSTNLSLPAGSYDETVVFFLLHEQPEDARRKTIAEAIRVTKTGGRLVFVDYHGPKKSNPMRYVMKPILKLLEPFAMDLWREELPAFMPDSIKAEQIESQFYFGGLYQKVTVQL